MFKTLSIALTTLAIPALVHAQSIRIEQECGFSYVPCGDGMVSLERDGANRLYSLYDSVGNEVSFSLAYRGDFFLMTALADNSVSEGGYLPFGWAVYAGTGPVINLDSPDSTALGFIPVFSFPDLEGKSARVFVPTAAVPEAGGLAMMLAGLGAVGAVARRRRWGEC
jgi:hypothetical protein